MRLGLLKAELEIIESRKKELGNLIDKHDHIILFQV